MELLLRWQRGFELITAANISTTADRRVLVHYCSTLWHSTVYSGDKKGEHQALSLSGALRLCSAAKTSQGEAWKRLHHKYIQMWNKSRLRLEGSPWSTCQLSYAAPVLKFPRTTRPVGPALCRVTPVNEQSNTWLEVEVKVEYDRFLLFLPEHSLLLQHVPVNILDLIGAVSHSYVCM